MSAPLVLVHGSFGCGEDWRALVDRLDRPAATPDLPGHGERFDEPATSFDDTAAALAAQLPAGCDLVGYSLGGRLALAAALHAPPGHVRSLVLESAQPGLDEPARARRLALDRARAEAIAADPGAFLTTFYGAELFASFRADPRYASLLAERTERARRAPAALAATFAALSPGNQPQLTPALLDRHLPTLMIVGSLDTKYRQIARELAAARHADRDLQIAEVDGAGHNVHFEQPDAYLEALRAFWRKLA